MTLLSIVHLTCNPDIDAVSPIRANCIDVSGKYKESFRLGKNLKTSLVYPRKDSNVVSVEDHVHL